MSYSAARPSRHGILAHRPYLPGGYAPAAFRQTVLTRNDASGYLTGWEADAMLRRTADRHRPLTALLHGELHLQGRRGRTTVALRPIVHPKELTARQYKDLELISHAGTGARLLRDADGSASAVDAGFSRIPYVQTTILLGRGWLTQVPHTDQVWISAAGRMAMAFHWHAQQQLPAGVLKGLYLDAVLAAADTSRCLSRGDAGIDAVNRA